MVPFAFSRVCVCVCVSFVLSLSLYCSLYILIFFFILSLSVSSAVPPPSSAVGYLPTHWNSNRERVERGGTMEMLEKNYASDAADCDVDIFDPLTRGPLSSVAFFSLFLCCVFSVIVFLLFV